MYKVYLSEWQRMALVELVNDTIEENEFIAVNSVNEEQKFYDELREQRARYTALVHQIRDHAIPTDEAAT